MATAEEIGTAMDQRNTVGEEPVEVDLGVGEDIEIEVVDDRPEEDRREPASKEALEAAANDDLSDDELKALSRKAQDRIRKLKWQYHEERRAKEQAERLASEAVSFTKKTQGLLTETQKALGTVAQRRADAALAEAEKRLELAYEEGNAAAIAASTKALQQATMAQAWAPQAAKQVAKKFESESEPETAEAEQQPSVPTPDPKAQEWAEKNPWFHQDPEMTSFAYGVHEKLVREGVQPDTDDYYRRIDNRMRQVFPGEFEEAGATTVDTSSQATKTETVVAPATRNNGARPRKITLSATQVRLAKRLGLTNAQYAEQLLKEQGS